MNFRDRSVGVFIMNRFLSILLFVAFYLNAHASSKEVSSIDLDSETDIEFCWFYYDFAFYKASEPDFVRVQLEEIAEFINSYPDAKFKIGAYTDSRGSETYNRMLSQKIADYIRVVLIRNGVDPYRLVSVGYGMENPIVKNAQTEMEHEQNRRVEIRFLK